MAESRVSIATLNGGRYLRQLCKHWAHRLEVEETGDQACLRLPQAFLTMAADPSALHIHLRADQDGDLQAMQEVVSSHLDRFAFREAPFALEWVES
ncbi:MAG: DUF2218 domain-containing protein [Sphingobium sp.]